MNGRKVVAIAGGFIAGAGVGSVLTRVIRDGQWKKEVTSAVNEVVEEMKPEPKARKYAPDTESEPAANVAYREAVAEEIRPNTQKTQKVVNKTAVKPTPAAEALPTDK